MLQQLEPNNPATHLGAAVCLQMGGGDVRAAVEAYLRMFELGQQQRSDYWTVHGAGAALLIAFQSPLTVGHDILAAALAVSADRGGGSAPLQPAAARAVGAAFEETLRDGRSPAASTAWGG